MRTLADKVQPVPHGGGQPNLWHVPPFPGRRCRGFRRVPGVPQQPPSLEDCLSAALKLRVGGTYWGAQPALPERYLLVRSQGALGVASSLADEHGEILAWSAGAGGKDAGGQNGAAISGECDPWHMLSRATAVLCEAGDEIRPIAALLDIPILLASDKRVEGSEPPGDRQRLLAEHFPVNASFEDPFGGAPLDLRAVIELCGHWRALIDSNRSIAAAVGVAFWKQESIRPLLWNGSDDSGLFRAPATKPEGAVAIWRSKTPAHLTDRLERMGTALVEVEDGFLRSNGLGADCVAPLSITVDRLGAYFDPGQPSELELMLEHEDFDAATLDRARRLRATIVAEGLGKYERGGAALERLDAARRLILVTGQVEDDRSILTGGAGLTSNVELLERVRAQAPEATIIYKPHPDVLAGHRKGDIPERRCRELADRIETEASIASLIDLVDEVHVNTSLAGFEALLRDKKVTTYGVPFYSGWGLTNDLGPTPPRRTRRRSVDELVAATLLLYPRYYDPVSGLPCPAEVVVDRLTEARPPATGLLVALRRFQGRLRRSVQRLSR